MPTSGGNVVYSVDHAPVTARGYILTNDELDTCLRECVAPSLRDDQGVADIRDLLAGVLDTDFATDALEEVLDSREAPLDWQIGEAIAEAHLSSHGFCVFPWPTSRDLRDLKASLPGTDLVGFQKTSDVARPYRFAFGEVKTSHDAETPPNLMYGRHGLKQQMEDLRDTPATRHTLFLYLAHRAKHASWAEHFRHAAGRYLAESSDVALFGVLVRDVNPAADDLRARAKALAKDCPAQTGIALLAIYLPADAIADLVRRINDINRGGSHVNN